MSGRKKFRKPRQGALFSLSTEVDLSPSCSSLDRKSRPKRKRSPQKRTRAGAARQALQPIVDITQDDCPELEQIVSNVNNKVGRFFESCSFISSEEEDTDLVKVKTIKTPISTQFLISDDSDDECKMVTKTSDVIEIDCEPSTSSGSSEKPRKDNKKPLNDDIMDFVDSIFKSNTEVDVNEKRSRDVKSLEDFRKETEEMLKNASSLLEEIKGKPAEIPPKKEDSPAKITVGCCPICLESLATLPVYVTICGHLFCKPCLSQAVRSRKRCPTCRKVLNMKKIHPVFI